MRGFLLFFYWVIFELLWFPLNSFMCPDNQVKHYKYLILNVVTMIMAKWWKSNLLRYPTSLNGALPLPPKLLYQGRCYDFMLGVAITTVSQIGQSNPSASVASAAQSQSVAAVGGTNVSDSARCRSRCGGVRGRPGVFTGGVVSPAIFFFNLTFSFSHLFFCNKYTLRPSWKGQECLFVCLFFCSSRTEEKNNSIRHPVKTKVHAGSSFRKRAIVILVPGALHSLRRGCDSGRAVSFHSGFWWSLFGALFSFLFKTIGCWRAMPQPSPLMRREPRRGRC